MGCFTVLVLALAFFLLVRWLVRRARVEASGKQSLSRNEYGPRVEMIRDRQTGSSIPLRWIEPNETVTIARRNVGGMIYVGSAQRRAYSGFAGGTFIDPDLPVAREGSDFSGAGLPYWPSYCDIDPRARATYLDWLAGGREDRRYAPGYVFLFFYGLERRFFVDDSTVAEKCVLVEEVERLLQLYGDNRSIRGYLTRFVDAERIVLAPSSDDLQLSFERSGYELPLGLRVAIGRMVKEQQPLSAEWLLAWYLAHPETRLRTPATRASREFRELFHQLFDERFPGGLSVRPPKRFLRLSYRAASADFEVDLGHLLGDIPDIAVTSKSLNVARALAEAATDALDKYSRFLGRNPDGRDTIGAHALLPSRLWPVFPCAEMEDLRHWADTVIDAGGLSPIERVVGQLEGAPPEKVGRRQLTGTADALARLSIGMAPDPRFALRSPKVGESVVLFRLPEGITALEEVSEEYREILLVVAMGGFIAHADGAIAARERRALEDRIHASAVSEAERARLLANLQWMLVVPPDLPLLRRRMKGLSGEARQEMGRVALAMALADGAIAPGEIEAIKRLYRAIGLRSDGVYSDLHALALQSEPVTVRPAGEPDREFAIPPQPERDTKVALDPERLAALVADTARVSAVLGNIFQEDEAGDEPEELEERSEAVTGRFQGLDDRHAALLRELLLHSRWSETEFADLTAQFRLMQAGTLETLNEWSFSRFGAILIEVYEGYELNPEVVRELKDQGMIDADT